MTLNPLDAANEFQDDAAAAEAKAAADKAAADKAAADAKEKDDLKAEVGTLKQTLTEKLQAIEGLQSKTAILDKLQEALGAKPEDPKDKYITDEIRRRLGSDLSDIAKIKQVLPLILEAVGAVAEDKLSERVDTAQDVLKAAMDKEGLDTSDEETVAAMEEATVAIIRRDPKLQAMWNKGNVKKAVSEAYDRIQAKFYAPVRAKAKRSAVNTILDAPKPSPRGGAASAPAGKGSNTVDTRDTSRDGIRKVHDAAFERLQELMGDN